MAPSSGTTPASPSTNTFTAYSDALQAAALNTTRLAATSLPSDLPFHRSIDPALARDVDAFSTRILGLTGRLVVLATGKTDRIEEEEDIVDGFVRNIVDSMEGMLESTDSALDVFLGRKKDPVINVPVVAVDSRQNTKPKACPPRGRLDPALTHASHLPKPQLKFKHSLSNTDESPYIPASLIPHKWCAKVPLGYVFHDEQPTTDAKHIRDEGAEEEERKKHAIHPYYYELTHPSYPNHVFSPPSSPLHPAPLDISSTTSAATSQTSSHPLTFVSTSKSLLALANIISTSTELAIDLEHHSYRSYRGFLALMQISTREADFVVDLLMAREAGQIIARVFADPSVIKVFHGAESDIVWLQQDFNIFVVGLFDTFHASKLLDFPKHGLANLLETYCDFIPDKRYQLADWRIRPLPADMLTYARSDTHFLLYIYDKLRHSLVERASGSLPPSTSDATISLPKNTTQINPAHALIHAVLARSSRTALRLHEIEVYDADRGTGSGGWDTLARKWNKGGLLGGGRGELGTETQRAQCAVYRAVHRWREYMAREEDESTRYVLPTHHLFLLAERIPTTVPELLSLFGGLGGVSGGVPPVLRRRAGELVGVIISATEVTKSTSDEQRLSQGQGEGMEMPVPVVAGEESMMDTTTTSLLAIESTRESRLWAVATSSASSVAAATARSSLFSTKSTFTHDRISNTSAERFKGLVERIHKTLIIAPVVSTPAVSTQPQESTAHGMSIDAGTNNSSFTASVTAPPGSAAQVEIPFVPAHQRQSQSNSLIYAPLEDDTIIVVGQGGARQRKRKREKPRGVPSKSGARSGAADSGSSTGDQEGQAEEFDYANVPNLLDNTDDGREGSEPGGVGDRDEKKRKKQKQYGNFRVPPRDQREVKSGNKAHTFR
ncbi:ribonuclease H-like domain-containing protein [Melanogaster broomeanus]|nr:ribonuclease H-like domain-containing protein [Melanogaster broomeanus]